MYELNNEARILDLETELFGMGMNEGAHNEDEGAVELVGYGRSDNELDQDGKAIAGETSQELE